MNKSFFYIAGALILLSSCAKELNTPLDTTTRSNVRIIAKTNDETKTTASIDGSGKAQYAWQADEKIKVIDASTTAKSFTLSDAVNGYFVNDEAITGDPILGVTPAGALTAVAGYEPLSYTLAMPSEYANYVPGTTNDVMVGSKTGKSGDDYIFGFYHAAAVMKVQYVNVPIGTKKFVFTADKNINGTWSGLSSSSPELSTPASGSTTTALVLEEAVYEANQTMDFYVPLPIATYGRFDISLKDGSNNDIAGTVRHKEVSTPIAKADYFETPAIGLSAATKGSEWSYTFTNKSELVTGGASVNGLLLTSSVNCDQIESSGSARGAAFQSGADPTITIPYSGFIESVVVVCSTNNGSNKISVKVDDISLGTQHNITNGSPNEIHTFKIDTPSRYRKGNIKVIVSNGGNKSTWIKSIAINSDIRVDANLSYSVANMSVPVGASPFVNPLTKPDGLLGIVYSSSDSSIASVDSETGEVTIGSKTGTARITATFDGNETYRAGSAYYDIEVSQLVYVYCWINGEKNTIATVEGQSLDAILPVNPNCGIAGYQFAGWSESTVAPTDTEPSYTSKTVVPDGGDLTLYAVFVKQGEETVPATPISFVPDNCASTAQSYTHNDSVNGVQMTVSNGICNTTEFRIYKSQTLIITSTTRNITDVDITGVSGNPASNFNEPSGWTKTIDGDNGNWHTSASKTSITLTASTAQARATEIVVTLASYTRTTYSGYTTSPVE